MSRKKSKKSEFIFDLDFFCNKLKHLREEKNLRPAQLEREIGLTRGMWETYEGGSSIPGLDAAVQIAHYFGESLDLLVLKGTKIATIAHVSPSNQKKFVDLINKYLTKADLNSGEWTVLFSLINTFFKTLLRFKNKEGFLHYLEEQLRRLGQLLNERDKQGGGL